MFYECRIIYLNNGIINMGHVNGQLYENVHIYYVWCSIRVEYKPKPKLIIIKDTER